MINFNQKTVWITGASSGIGKALAIKFASLGANLVISSRNEELLKELANSCNSNTFILPLDLEKSSDFHKWHNTCNLVELFFYKS
ncbi:SDR family NAD(P)-dependent oxidoreductase [Flavobacteriales bacterium]|nr:SDR family NAD(P)-dependent oxidoreductase [Flavobacteriales bacterium]